MSVQVKWLQNSRVIYNAFGELVTTDDIHMASLQTDFYMQGQSRIHAITDLSNVKTFPASLTKVQQALTPPPFNRGWMLMVIPEHNPLLRFVGAYAGQLRAIDGNLRIFRTLAGAIEFLNTQEVDLNLPYTIR